MYFVQFDKLYLASRRAGVVFPGCREAFEAEASTARVYAKHSTDYLRAAANALEHGLSWDNEDRCDPIGSHVVPLPRAEPPLSH